MFYREDYLLAVLAAGFAIGALLSRTAENILDWHVSTTPSSPLS